MLETFLNIDGGILLLIQEFIRNPVLNPVMVFITTLGDRGMIWIAATVLLLIPKKTRKIGVMSAPALIGSLLINNELLKNLVRRPRPFQTFTELATVIPRPGQFSFPSGHSSASFAAAVVFYRNLPKKAGVPALVLAVLIAFSRLYVGVHYPTDVLAGALLGSLLACGAEKLVNFCAEKRKVSC